MPDSFGVTFSIVAAVGGKSIVAVVEAVAVSPSTPVISSSTVCSPSAKPVNVPSTGIAVAVSTLNAPVSGSAIVS